MSDWTTKSSIDILADIDTMLKKANEIKLPKPLPKGYRMNQIAYDYMMSHYCVLHCDFGEIPFSYLRTIGLQIVIDNTLEDKEIIPIK